MRAYKLPERYRGIRIPADLRAQGGNVNHAWWSAGVRSTLEAVRPLLAAFAEHETEPCRPDHHGACQEHGFSGPPCGVKQARDFLAASGPEMIWQFGEGMEWCYEHKPEGVTPRLVSMAEAARGRTWMRCVQCGVEMNP